MLETDDLPVDEMPFSCTYKLTAVALLLRTSEHRLLALIRDTYNNMAIIPNICASRAFVFRMFERVSNSR